MTEDDLDFSTTHRSGPAIADELQDAEIAYAADTAQHGSTLILPESMLQRSSTDGHIAVVLSSPEQTAEEAAEAELLRDANAHLAAAGSDHFYGPWFPGTTGQHQSGYLSAEVGLENGRLGLLIDTGAYGNLQGD